MCVYIYTYIYIGSMVCGLGLVRNKGIYYIGIINRDYIPLLPAKNQRAMFCKGFE